MKKNLLILLFLTAFFANIFAQTIVGTDPENKNVVLEEFTGIHCVYCPQGHAIAQAIYDAHPNDVVLINIHTGSFANPSPGEPDFRTPWGDAIAAQSGLTGYPAGTVNRHLFPGMSQGSGTAMSRGNWTTTANQTLAQESYLNVGCEATVTAAGQLTVNVEVYYTGDSPETTNLLNVAILQNNILGPQTGGTPPNNYNHMHMLRHLITGQWGVEITETTEGSLYSNTFSYDIPADYNGVPVVLEDLDIVAFVSETHQEIVSGVKGTLVMEAAYDYDVTVSEVFYPLTEACSGEIAPRIAVKNYGALDLTSADIEYSVNDGDVYTYEWTGNLLYNETEEFVLPAIPLNIMPNNTLEITISNPNGIEDENPNNNTTVVNFEQAPETSTNIEMQLFVGANGSQISWEFYNEDGELLESGDGYGNNEIVNMELPVSGGGCYTFYLYDSGNDGFVGGGYLKLYDDGTVFSYITNQLEGELGITFESMNPLAAPMEFNAEIDNYDITFTWTAPSKATLLGYNIYEASDMETPVNSTLISDDSYTYTVDGNGSYEFYLAAMYDEGMSDLVGPVLFDLNVGTNNLELGNINIYPNPIHQTAQLNFQLKESSQVEWSIYNLTGSKVMDSPNQIMNAGEQNINIQTNDLEDGIYFLNLVINGESNTQKISVIK